MGTLYYGDNLDILKRYIADETIDLVYLDPPFNSAQNYNAFFQEKDGSAAASQIRAFEDTWSWNMDAEAVYKQLTEQPGKVAEVMTAFMTFLGRNDMMAYLAMMAPRLVELRRALKPTGSLYLHCDTTASHYLKLLLDAVFGPNNFRNEITWKRRVGMSSAVHESNTFGVVTDIILFYSQSAETEFHPQYNKDDPDYQRYIEERFTYVDESGRKFQPTSLVNPAHRPNLIYEYKGYKPPPNGWMITKQKMEAWDKEGRIYFPKDKDGRLRRKSFADELKGMPIQNLWTDIPEINSQSAERLGYPTQKPVALLERIIKASSNLGDMVLDPFCGCGTTIDAAEKLGRKWIGIDITQLATSLIKNRLRDTYGEKIEINTIGEPTTPIEAQTLAEQDKYQFQWWALGLVGARPVEQKKGADHGIDGKILFRDDVKSTKPEQIIIQVKGGGTTVKDVRDLRGVLDREQAAIGVLISLNAPTKPMLAEAASAGFYIHKLNGQQFAKLQLRTVKELMEGQGIERPSSVAAVDETFKKAPKTQSKGGEQKSLEL
jgi:site-specific DNA-methyltransferase (adenine-specific)